MIDISEYMHRDLVARQAHLDLESPCIERGGGGKTGTLTSTYCRALLADRFDTTIPNGMHILVCHACHNRYCSNPKHLYWGTAKENTADSKRNGSHTDLNACMVEKYGEEGATLVRSSAAKKAWEIRKTHAG